MSDMIRVGGLWKNTAKDGREYLSGGLGMARLLIFENGRKGKPSDPDYIMFVAEGKPQDRGEGERGSGSAGRPASSRPVPDEEVPF